MKFKTEKRSRPIQIEIDGKSVDSTETYEVKIPVAPRDWDKMSTKVVVGLVLVLTAISIGWSTVAIGALLLGGIGYAAAALYDISWTVCLILEWKARYDADKRTFPRNLGWALLITTMFFIGWHGVEKDNIALAVVGASVSLFAKILWLGIMKHIDRDLSPQHREWVRQAISEANAKMAVAEVKRQVAHMESAALVENLALEAAHRQFDPIRAEQVPTEDVTARTPQVEQPVLSERVDRTTPVYEPVPPQVEPRTAPVLPVYEAPAPVTTLPVPLEVEPPVLPVYEPVLPSRTAPYTARTTADNLPVYEPVLPAGVGGTALETCSREEAIKVLIALIRADRCPSYSEAEAMFKRPKQTVVGWVKAAKIKADEGTGNFL